MSGIVRRQVRKGCSGSRDITAQVEAQEQIAEQRERLRVTLSSIGDAVMATDAIGRLSYLNPIVERLTGWASSEAEGRPLEEVFRRKCCSFVVRSIVGVSPQPWELCYLQ